MNEKLEKGFEIFAEVYGDEMAKQTQRYMQAGEGFDALQVQWTMEWAFGSVWARDELPRKLRSLAVLGMLIGQSQAEEIRYHTKMGIANGLTRAEIEEVLITAVPYCGFPAANTAKLAVKQAFEEMQDAGPA